MDIQISFSLLFLLSVFLILIFKKHFSPKKSHYSPPSPPCLPILGHFHLIKNNPLHISLASLSSIYGSIFSLRLGCKSFLVISSPSAVEECFTKNDVVFANRPHSLAGDHLTYNYAAFVWSPYGHLWRTLRKLSVVELFSSHSLQKSAQIREQEILKLARSLHKDRRNRVDLNELISIYSFNIMMRSVAGKELVGEEEIGGEAGKEAVKRFRGIFAPGLVLSVCDYFPMLRWIGYKGMEKDLMAMNEKRDQFLQSLVDEVRAEKKTTEERRRKSLIQTLLSLQEDEPEFYGDDVVKSILTEAKLPPPPPQLDQPHHQKHENPSSATMGKGRESARTSSHGGAISNRCEPSAHLRMASDDLALANTTSNHCWASVTQQKARFSWAKSTALGNGPTPTSGGDGTSPLWRLQRQNSDRWDGINIGR